MRTRAVACQELKKIVGSRSLASESGLVMTGDRQHVGPVWYAPYTIRSPPYERQHIKGASLPTNHDIRALIPGIPIAVSVIRCSLRRMGRRKGEYRGKTQLEIPLCSVNWEGNNSPERE
jgi:hypothetical protein